MKKTFWIGLTQFLSFFCFSQTKLLPGDKSFDLSKLRSTIYTMSYSVTENGAYVEIGKFRTEVSYVGGKIDIKTKLSFVHANDIWIDHIVADGKTFKPISISSERSDRNLSLQFENEIRGVFQDNKSKKRSTIKEKWDNEYFDISIYPYMLFALPLETGYKASIPVYNYEAISPKDRYSNVVIRRVRSDEHKSTFTGVHKVWIVSVFEESTNQNYEYYIDKKTGEVWRIILIANNSQSISLVNIESEFNPVKSKFDRNSTLRLITEGNSVIKGQAFARDNKNGGALQGKAVINLNKKQYAAKGTSVLLMPYTAYFKEWVTINSERVKKLLPQIPLMEGANECIKQAKVIDDEGNFEFTNLMPGEYLVTIKFIYDHSATETNVVGYTDYYIDNHYQGSNAITESYNFVAGGTADIKKVVRIRNVGEKVQIKLKKTL